MSKSRIIKRMRFMTRREWIALDAEPHKINDEWYDGVYGCPKNYGFSDGKHILGLPDSDCFSANCNDCWNKPAIVDGKYIFVLMEDETK